VIFIAYWRANADWREIKNSAQQLRDVIEWRALSQSFRHLCGDLFNVVSVNAYGAQPSLHGQSFGFVYAAANPLLPRGVWVELVFLFHFSFFLYVG
jgi:hypothetical protein